MTDINEIKSRLSIEEVISSYIKLEQNGSSFKALCPFHNEKSASFNVSPSRGIYKCFGCGESGDIFNFVEKFEGISFEEALDLLANKAGVEITKSSNKSKKQKEEEQKEEQKLLKILEEATTFFQLSLLQNKEVKEYLKKRGVDGKTAKKFRLGYAKDSWNSLKDFLIMKGYEESDIEKVGLIKKNEKGSIYDRFRNRIIFPIFNIENKPVAFSGRDFSGKDNVAKYLNSPETIFYDKSDILYGLNFAKVEARKRKYFIIVEGQMDLIMSHKVGFENTVATSGTSLTEKHLKNLARFSDKLIFAFDSDNAGVEASFRGMKMALSKNFDVKILNIKKDSDPADMILESADEWINTVKDSRNIIDFFIKRILLKDVSVKDKVKEMEEKILPFVAKIKNPIEKGQYISKIANGFDVETMTISTVLKKISNDQEIETRKKIKEEMIRGESSFDIFSKSNIINSTKKIILKQLTAIYYWQQNLKEIDRWEDPNIILQKIEEYSDKTFKDKILSLNNAYIDTLVLEVESVYKEKESHALSYDLKSFYKRLEKTFIKEEISKLQKELSISDNNTTSKILQKIQNLNTKLKNANF